MTGPGQKCSQRAGPEAGSAGAVPLSNRRGTSSFSEERVFVGVDRVSVSFPLQAFNSTEGDWSSVTILNPGKDSQQVRYGTTEPVGGATAFLGVSVIKATGQATGKVELNPARVQDSEGWELAGVEAVAPAVLRALRGGKEYFRPSCPAGEAKVRRLDVARDFEGVARSGSRIRALGPLHRPWARRNLVHADPARNGAQTLMVGSGAGVVRLYDKQAETKGRAPAGTLRWEAECRTAWLKQYGNVRHLEEVTATSVEELAKDRWEWSAMGCETGAMGRVYELVRSSGLSDREQATFLGWLWRQAAGDPWDVAFATAAKWRRWQRELGIVIEPGALDDQAGGLVSRLDWDSGRELYRAA